jgi:hypothetical protein
MNKTINIQCGIYDTVYRLIQHRDGDISVKSPTIKWVGNTGSLAFITTRVADCNKNKVLQFFRDEELCNDDGHILDDYL